MSASISFDSCASHMSHPPITTSIQSDDILMPTTVNKSIRIKRPKKLVVSDPEPVPPVINECPLVSAICEDPLPPAINEAESHVLSHLGSYTEEPFQLIETYFRGQHLDRLVRHQIESYNHFITYQIQRTIQMFNSVTVHSENDYVP